MLLSRLITADTNPKQICNFSETGKSYSAIVPDFWAGKMIFNQKNTNNLLSYHFPVPADTDCISLDSLRPKQDRRAEQKIQELKNRVAMIPHLQAEQKRIYRIIEAIVHGDYYKLISALRQYSQDPDALINDRRALMFVFQETEIGFLNSMVFRVQKNEAKFPLAVNLLIQLKGTPFVLSISTSPELESTALKSVKGKSGHIYLEPIKEDPIILCKRLSACSMQSGFCPPPSYMPATNY